MGSQSMFEGVRILAFTQFLFGPATAQYLADLGAAITKIEPPGTGAWERSWAGGGTFVNGESAFYLMTHRNARSVTLDLKSPDAKIVLERLLESTDVLLGNFRPGVLERLGLDYESVKRVNPSLIYAIGSGYGPDGPASRDAGQDLLLQARAGLVAATGREGAIPAPAGAAVVDQHAASLLAMGIAAALFHRERTGRGQQVDVNMLEAALDIQSEPITYHLNGGSLRAPLRGLGSSFHPGPYGIYPTLNGHVAISLSPLEVLSTALGSIGELDAIASRGGQLDERERVYDIVASHLVKLSTEEWLPRLLEHGVWAAKVQDYDEVFTDPPVTHLAPVVTINHPAAGPVRLLKHPVHYSDWHADDPNPPPELGADTDQVLAECGFSHGQIDELRSKGVV